MIKESYNIKLLDKLYSVDLSNPVIRFPKNPILTPMHVNQIWTDPKYQVITTHNAGISFYNGKIIMLFRSHLRNGISVIGMAMSEDGLTNWEILPHPVLKPCNKDDMFVEGTNIEELIENEEGGVEDPRISLIDDTYYITYSAYHGTIKDRVRISLITTKDFKSFMRHGPVLNSDMRNVVIFPDKINDRYVALFRPNDHNAEHTGGIFKEILIGYSNKIEAQNWDIIKQPVLCQEDGPSSFSDKIGPGATPFLTPYGWMNIFHGVRKTMDGNPYVLGVGLHETENPENVKVSNIPILFPSPADCLLPGSSYIHVPNVVFTCGTFCWPDGRIYIYYGGNDTVMNIAITHQDILAALCVNYPQDQHTGKPLFTI